MKKAKFLLINTLIFGTFAGSSLTSCSSEVVTSYQATVNFEYDSDIVTVEIKNAKESYSEGDVISLNLTFDEGYALSFATLNGNEIEDVNSVTLEAGTNFIKIYAKTTGSLSGSTNIRDFTFQAVSATEYGITSYVPTGIYPEVVEIPETYLGKNVTTIAANAFVSAGGISYIKISKNITNIQDGAFKSLSTLKGFEVDEANTAYASLDGNLYDKNTTLFIAYAQANPIEVSLPSTVKTIKDSAFYGANRLEAITLNEGLKTISANAFYGCQSLKSIVIPNTVTTIGEYAFKGCSVLKTVTLSTNLTGINDYTFMQCLDLTDLEIPSSVKYIGAGVFLSCYDLKTIKLNEGLEELRDDSLSYSGIVELKTPNSLRKVGKNTFAGCDNLTKVTFNEGLEELGDYTFNINKLLSYVNIPSTVTKIGKAAFTACLSLKEFDVSADNTAYKAVDGVLFTKDGKTLIAYPNSKDAKSYTIPEGTETLDFRSFAYISNNPYSESSSYYSLEELTIPTSVTTIKNSFYGGKLKKITYLGTVAQFNEIASKTHIDETTEYSWNDGASIETVECSDGTWSN